MHMHMHMQEDIVEKASVKKKLVVFDIETGKAKNYLDFMPKFNEEFDESEVKHGNIKDPQKITEKIESERRIFYEKIQKKKQKWIDECALSAITGRVICVGINKLVDEINDYNPSVISYTDEKETIECFWDIFHRETRNGKYFVGWNCYNFDWPFLIQRSRILRINTGLNPMERKNTWVIDLNEVWCGNIYGRFESLNNVAMAMGFGGKDEEVSRNFEWFWNNERKKAFDHVLNDVELTTKIANVIFS